MLPIQKIYDSFKLLYFRIGISLIMIITELKSLYIYQ